MNFVTIDSRIITVTFRGEIVEIAIMNIDAIAMILFMRGAKGTVGEDMNPAIVKERALATKESKAHIDVMNALVLMGVMNDEVEVVVEVTWRIAMKMATLRGVKDEGITIMKIKYIIIWWHHKQWL